MKEEQIVQLEINGGIIYHEKYLPNNLGLVGFEVFSSLIKLSQENARYREALEVIALAQEQWSLEATLRSFVFELQKRTEIAQRALKGGE